MLWLWDLRDEKLLIKTQVRVVEKFNDKRMLFQLKQEEEMLAEALGETPAKLNENSAPLSESVEMQTRGNLTTLDGKEDTVMCKVCLSGERADEIMLCDGCDAPYWT